MHLIMTATVLSLILACGAAANPLEARQNSCCAIAQQACLNIGELPCCGALRCNVIDTVTLPGISSVGVGVSHDTR